MAAMGGAKASEMSVLWCKGCRYAIWQMFGGRVRSTLTS